MTDRHNLTSDATMAVYLDLENIALGARDAKYPSFDIQQVLVRLLLKGHIVVKKAYCDFDRYKDFKRGLHEAAFELIEIPHVRQSGKNSADIRMVVDALDLCYTKGHVDTFVIISGDSDFSPLVSKLRENAKTVIGVGVKNSTSDLFLNNCDDFIYYDDLVRKQPSKSRRRSAAPAVRPGAAPPENGVGGIPSAAVAVGGIPATVAVGGIPAAVAVGGISSAGAVGGTPGTVQAVGGTPLAAGAGATQTVAGSPGVAPTMTGTPAAAGAGALQAVAGAPAAVGAVAENRGPDLADALDLVVETLEAVTEERGENEPIWGSMIKQAIKRRHPGFNERAYGFRSFNDLLADAQRRGLLDLRADEKSGGYTVRVSERGPAAKT